MHVCMYVMIRVYAVFRISVKCSRMYVVDVCMNEVIYYVVFVRYECMYVCMYGVSKGIHVVYVYTLVMYVCCVV